MDNQQARQKTGGIKISEGGMGLCGMDCLNGCTSITTEAN
jgi:hypothetical protein